MEGYREPPSIGEPAGQFPDGEGVEHGGRAADQEHGGHQNPVAAHESDHEVREADECEGESQEDGGSASEAVAEVPSEHCREPPREGLGRLQLAEARETEVQLDLDLRENQLREAGVIQVLRHVADHDDCSHVGATARDVRLRFLGVHRPVGRGS